MADALLYAAEHPTRDMYAGGRAKLMGAGAYYAPRMLDKGMGRFMYTFVETGMPARDRDDNNLYTHKADLLERGGVGGRVHETSAYTRAAMHPATTRAMMLGAGLALVTMWQACRRYQPTR